MEIPLIIVSSLDLERLDRLREAAACRRLPGVDALRRELGRATVVAPEEVPPGLMTMNSTCVSSPP